MSRYAVKVRARQYDAHVTISELISAAECQERGLGNEAKEHMIMSSTDASLEDAEAFKAKIEGMVDGAEVPIIDMLHTKLATAYAIMDRARKFYDRHKNEIPFTSTESFFPDCSEFCANYDADKIADLPKAIQEMRK